MKKVALIGYSGHAYVAVDILEQTGYKIIGYVEKKPSSINPMKLTYLGYEDDNDFKQKLNNAYVFPAIGENPVRKRIIISLIERDIRLATAISRKANISIRTSIESGTLICQGACINPFSIIGKGVIINTGAIIEHECIISDFAHIAPGTILAGNVHIGESSFIGANSVVKQGIKIGKNAIVGAGAVVLKDIPDNEIWVGNPAKKLKNNS